MGKTVIVTGSSRGIGKAIALRLAHDGYDVCVNDVPANRPGCEEVAKEIQGLGRKACVAVADVSKRSEVAEMIQTSVKELGELNVMIANAGIAQVKSLIDLDDDAFQQLFNVNCTGVHNCYTEAAKQLIKQGNCTAEKPGKLIAASSIVGYKAFAALGHYSASKWWVRGYNQASAMEYADKHITCNTYAPGIAATAMWELIDEELGKDTNAAKGDTMQKYVDELIALKRPSTGEDVSKMVSFLASGDSDYCTGQSYLVDGGIIYT